MLLLSRVPAYIRCPSGAPPDAVVRVAAQPFNSATSPTSLSIPPILRIALLHSSHLPHTSPRALPDGALAGAHAASLHSTRPDDYCNKTRRIIRAQCGMLAGSRSRQPPRNATTSQPRASGIAAATEAPA